MEAIGRRGLRWGEQCASIRTMHAFAGSQPLSAAESFRTGRALAEHDELLTAIHEGSTPTSPAPSD